MEKKNNESRAVALLKEKLESNLRDYRNDWLTLSKEELIDRAEEVYSVCVIAAFLPKTVSEEQAEYLLQFRNPLEVVNDEWLGRNSFDEMMGTPSATLWIPATPRNATIWNRNSYPETYKCKVR